MNESSSRVFATLLMIALCAAAAPVAAQEADADEAPAQEEGAADETPSDDGDAPADADGEAASAGDDADDEQADDDDWETPMRNPITPSINREGGMGFHGIASAISPGPLNFQVGLLADTTGGSSFIRLNDEHQMLSGNVLVNASFLDYFAVHAGLEARNSHNTYGRPQAMLAQGDAVFGATGRYPVSDGIWLGGDVSLFVPSAFGGVGVSLPSATVRPRLLASFDVDQIMGAQDDLYVPVVAHLNIGYRIDNSESLVPEGTTIDRIERYAYGISAYDMVEFGLGVEVPVPYITPFLGWNLGIPVNASGSPCAGDRALDCVEDVGGAAFPHTLTIGAKGEPLDNLGLHAGIDIGLTPEQAEGLPATMPYQVHFGMSWNIDSANAGQVIEQEVETEIEVEPARGVVFGRVLDDESGEPIPGARISYVDRTLSAQLSNEEEGLFESYGFAPGDEITLEISHPDYESATQDWVVEEGSTEEEFYLTPIPRRAMVRGQVMVAAEEDAAAADENEQEEAGASEGAESAEQDEESTAGQPQPAANAQVMVRGGDGEITEVETDGEGRFEVEVGAGDITVAAMIDGYLTTGRYVEAEAEDEFDLSFELSPAESLLAEVGDAEITTQGEIGFASGGATIEENSHELLDHLAALILENPDVGDIEVQGHTDDGGEQDELMELSQQRADAVRQALIERGVAPDRLNAKGYGADNPIMPNTSSRNRSMNRRIEFHLID